ncbi:GspH/FimT family protein [Coralloluteibacterium stylophorae]|uniref:Type II secretion system protein H n=1 Tax=Coralloluteibacterium stylophorae TaxID=1776034 RepID=A0A8J7VTE1_9GAMM|nr:GspH/FimT family pseudopilin [Coralloluteibacterium stylophorae]MBS7456660.1 GspH/FimT family pseudopilin [Coralloluteibacterium stylophorae]
MRSRRNGLTLLELLVVVAILAIVTTVGLPAFGDVLQRTRAQTAMHQLTASIASARLAAIQHRRPLALCPADAAGACVDEPDWSAGWLVFVDADGNDRPDTDADLVRHVQTSGRIAIRSSAGRTRIRVQRDGRSGGSNLSLSLCSEDAEPRLLGRVILNISGRTRSERPTAPTPCPFAPGGAG